MNLQTERLLFSLPREQDVYDVYSHKRDAESTIFTGGTIDKSWPEFQEEYLLSCGSRDIGHKTIYSVILRDTDKYIGYCGFQYCEILGGTEILYGFSSQYWGKGYALEAARSGDGKHVRFVPALND